MLGLKVKLMNFLGTQSLLTTIFSIQTRTHAWYMNPVQLPSNLLCLITGLMKVISNNYSLIFPNLSSSPVVITSCAMDIRTFLDMGTP